MFASILVETGLYITKSYKSDLITQKATKTKKQAEQRTFDAYYANLKRHREERSNNQNGNESELNEKHSTFKSDEIDSKSIEDPLIDREIRKNNPLGGGLGAGNLSTNPVESKKDK